MTLDQLEQAVAALPSDDHYQRQLDEHWQKREMLSARILTIRSATAALAAVDPEIAACTKWFEHLTAWRKQLCDELRALPSPIRTDREFGKQRNLQLSILAIDRGVPA